MDGVDGVDDGVDSVADGDNEDNGVKRVGRRVLGHAKFGCTPRVF